MSDLSRAELRMMKAVMEADEGGRYFKPRRRAGSAVERTVDSLVEKGLVYVEMRVLPLPKARRTMPAIAEGANDA